MRLRMLCPKAFYCNMARKGNLNNMVARSDVCVDDVVFVVVAQSRER